VHGEWVRRCPDQAANAACFVRTATWQVVRDTQFYMSGIVGSEPVARDEVVAVLWQRQRSRLVRLAVGLTGERDAAEEIVQEAFASLLGRWRFLRDVSAAQAYLHRAVVNQAQARWRARRRSQVAAAIMTGRQEQSADPDLDSQLDMLIALGRLPWGKRACVLLRYYADLSEAQTAAVLGVSVGTVKSQTAKGLQQLAAVIDEQRTEMR
jgi:RNA polymerase sigma-70 factor (sigma-E family)